MNLFTRNLTTIFQTLLFYILAIMAFSCTKKECPNPVQTTDTVYTTSTQTKQITKVIIKTDTIKTFINDTTYITTIVYDTIRSTNKQMTLRQSASNDGDTYIHELIPLVNGSGSLYNLACNWTRFGTPTSYRFLIKFDLTSIKSSDQILSAKLFLTSRTTGATDEQTPDMLQTLNNDFQICLIKGLWTITTVTWSSQPPFSTTTGEFMNFPGSNLSNTQHVFDITTLVQKIAGTQQTFLNNGFLVKIRLEHDTYTIISPYQYESISFHSMNSTNFQYLPYLEIVLDEK